MRIAVSAQLKTLLQNFDWAPKTKLKYGYTVGRHLISLYAYAYAYTESSQA